MKQFHTGIRSSGIAVGGILVLLILTVLLWDRMFPRTITRTVPVCKECNVVMILLDPLRADGVHAFGNRRAVTPYLDQMAAGGVVFTNAYAVSSWTLPSAMSLFTGVYPSAHGVTNKELIGSTAKNGIQQADLRFLHPDMMTLASVFQAHGYITGGFAGGAALDPSYGFGKGFDVYESPGEFEGYDAVLPRALQFVREHKDEPMFLMVHGFDVHGQYMPPAGLTRAYVGDLYHGKLTGTTEEQKAIREEGVFRGAANITQQDKEFLRALYDEKLKSADARIASFVASYKALTANKKTIFVITSDHGEAFGEHGFIDHGMTLYDEMIHVPLIMDIPDMNPPLRITDQVRNIDLFPSLVSLVGLPVTARLTSQWQGTSLIPTLEGQNQRLDLFAETEYRHAVFLAALRTWDGWKLIYNRQALTYELFHVRLDPIENYNAVWEESDLRQQLTSRLIRWVDSVKQEEAGYNETP